MHKIITLSLSLLIVSMGFSQNAPINFETGGQGASWTWTTFENGTNPTLEVVNNPSSAAPNTSSKVESLQHCRVAILGPVVSQLKEQIRILVHSH